MEQKSLAVWMDDEPYELMDRVRFVLIEMGIKMKVTDSQDGCTVYSLSYAEPLTDGKKEKS